MFLQELSKGLIIVQKTHIINRILVISIGFFFIIFSTFDKGGSSPPKIIGQGSPDP